MNVPACPHCGNDLACMPSSTMAPYAWICPCGHQWTATPATTTDAPLVICSRCWSQAVVVHSDVSRCYACGTVFHPYAVPAAAVACHRCGAAMVHVPARPHQQLWACGTCDGTMVSDALDTPADQHLAPQRLRIPAALVRTFGTA